ncbi:MAG: M48 family metallopeptidase [Nitrospiraceae bacterium]
MSLTANALCFGEDFPGVGMPCTIDVSPQGLSVQFLTTSSQLSPKRIAFSSLAVSAGGFDHDHLVVKWGTDTTSKTLYLKDPALIVAFRKFAPPELMSDLERTAQQVRRSRHGRRTIIWAAAGALVVLVLGLWFGSDLLVEAAVDRVPVEWEQKIGEMAQRDFLAGQTVLHEGAAVQAVQEITDRLANKIVDNRYKFQITVVKSDVINAFALPGGYVVVFTGLLKKAESADEVAGVLAHELNHVLQRHALERVVKTMGMFGIVTILLGDQRGLIGLAKELSVELATLKFGREQETEADLTGLRLLHRARISPEGMIQFFTRLTESDTGRIELLSTHPMSAVRAERLRSEAASLSKQIREPFSFDWGKVEESLGRQ